nr:dTDP-4-dehydrorhamnose 3,5-epimerase family protein [Thermoanaerobacterium xylanolyticum]
MDWCNFKRRKQETVLYTRRFCTWLLLLSDEAEFCYKCTDFYHPDDEGGIIWNDPDIGIEWSIDGIEEIILSEKDKMWPRLKEILL